MAAIFDLDGERDQRLREFVDLGLDAIKIAVGEVTPKAGVAELQRAQRVLAGFEADLLAKHVTADGDSRAAERLLGDGKTSRRETRRRARRAKANAASGGTIGAKMAAGDLSEEQADHIADAAEASSGDAARDTDFVKAIGEADPDRGRQIKADWLAARETANGRQSEHDRQRSLRRFQSFVSRKNRLGVLMAEGDTVAHHNMVNAIQTRANEIYRRDGGRDLPLLNHPRTRTQREFDALYELICGLTTTPDGTDHRPTADTSSTCPTTPADSASTTNPIGDPIRAASATSTRAAGDQTTTTTDSPRAGATGPTSRRVTQSTRHNKSRRPQIIIGLTVDKLVGDDAAALATQHGLGLIPDSVLADYAQHGDILTALFDTAGEPLWLGRTRRNASIAQWIALVLRDRGCVLCSAPPNQCQAHHTTPWSAPAKGTTDIDKLALMCEPCHLQLHAQRLTLYRDENHDWVTRPATAEETPPPRPTQRRKQDPPQPGRGDPKQQE